MTTSGSVILIENELDEFCETGKKITSKLKCLTSILKNGRRISVSIGLLE